MVHVGFEFVMHIQSQSLSWFYITDFLTFVKKVIYEYSGIETIANY